MTISGDTITLTDDEFCNYIIYQNNKLNMNACGEPTAIPEEEIPHIKDIMKYALSDFFKEYRTLTRIERKEITEYMSVVFWDPSVKKLSDDKLKDLLRERARRW